MNRGLHKKRIVDKNGKRTSVWVSANKPEKKVEALGNCYGYAHECAAEYLGKKGVKIVYGTIEEWDGKKIKHAWVNDNGTIKDWQTMVLGTSKWKGEGIPEKEFNEHWKPKVYKEYTPKEVLNNVRDHKRLMAWDWSEKPKGDELKDKL